ncbi:NAC domain-containing protein 82-like [Corylus avellana]|uniref:NAC domain-containing protein 82-like n=1 Tax=Corylus avellana TaxID=13451 RepID=UPI00286B7FA4|nr:NAC domain-containing protein 82-like [Corylus avellana]
MAAMSRNLPLGFRFRPTEVEIIDYLWLKITGNDGEVDFIPVVDFFKQEPWELPGLSGIATKDQQRFCFSPPDMKQPNGKLFNRTTNSGFWKVTGKDKEIWSGGRLIGKKKILVFHLGSTKNSKKTDWVMHEHHTTLEELDGTKLPGQKPYVFCRLFYKPKQNSGKAPESPALDVQAEDRHPTTNESRHSENSDGMACDTIATTRPAKSASESPDKGSKGRKRKYPAITKAGPSKSKRRVDLQPETPLTSLSDAAAVSFPNTAKSSPEEAESDPRQASASGEEGDKQVTGYCPAKNLHETTANTIAFTELKHINDNTEKAQVTDTEFDQLLQEELKLLPFLLQNQIDWNVNSPAVPSPNTAKSSPEEAESDPRQAPASPASGEEADNHVTSFSPTKNLDESTSNTKAFTGCNRISDNTQTTKSTAGDQVGDSNMSCAPPELPVPDIDWSSLLLSPVHSQMQKVLDPFSMSSFDANETNYLYDGVAWQNGTIDSAAYCSEFWDLMPDESLRNDPSSQKTLAFDPRPWFMESDKDDGSHSAPNAKKLNALLQFDPTVQDSVRSIEINTEAVSSGSYIDGGTSSIRSS